MESISGSATLSPEQKKQSLRLLAMALGSQGVFCFYLDQHEKSRRLLDRSLDLLREHGDPRELSYFLLRSAWLAREAGGAAKARHILQESLAVSRLVADQAQTASALRHLGYMEGEAEDFAAANEHFDEALALGRAAGDEASIANTLTSYGFVRYLAGDLPAALAMLNESLAVYERVGDSRAPSAVLDNLGYAYAAAGDVAAARANFARALRLARETHKVALTLDIVLGWSATLSTPEDAQQAVALITFAAEHPAAWLETKDRAAHWLCARSAALTGDSLAAAQVLGRALRYEEVIRGMIGE